MKALISAALALALSAMASAPALADQECSDLASVKSEVEQMAVGPLRLLSPNQLQFARGLYTATAPISHYPAGESAIFARLPKKLAMVIFVDGDDACKFGMSDEVANMLVDIDRSF